MPVIDAHTHVFPPDVIARREMIAKTDARFALLYANPRARMVDGAGITEYLQSQGVEQAVVTSFPFTDASLVSACNDYVLELARMDTRVIPFATVDMEDETAARDEAERCVIRGARGIGEIAFYDTGYGKRECEKLHVIGAYAEQQGIPVMLHVNEQVGHAYHGKTVMDLQEIFLFIEAHPDLTVILPHLGGGLCFYEFMPEVRKTFSRVYYDLAATPLLYSSEVYDFVARYIPDRMLFGSDFPLLSYRKYATELGSLGDEARDKLLYHNARRMLGND
jgi:uncharacterized protein